MTRVIRQELLRDVRSHPDYDAVKQKLEQDLEQYKDSVTEQGSELWRIQRAIVIEPNGRIHCSIGGSELPAVMGVDPYRDQNSLIARKSHFLVHGEDPPTAADDDPTAATWGHVLEPLLHAYLGRYFDTDVYSLEASVVHRHLKMFRYSPDGFIILRVHREVQESDPETGEPITREEDRLEVALLELKNPFQRSIKGLGIPAYYVDQIMSGMDVFQRVVQSGLFAEANFMIQRLSDWGRPVYSARIHYKSWLSGKKGKERYDGLELVDSALIGFAYTEYSDRPALNELKGLLMAEGGWNMTHEVFDVGEMSEVMMKRILKLYKEGQFALRYSSFHRLESASLADTISQVRFGGDASLAARVMRGEARSDVDFVMPAGLFRAHWYKVEKDANYVLSRTGIIRSFCERLKTTVDSMGGLHEKFRPGWTPLERAPAPTAAEAIPEPQGKYW